jgi:hypothetical protein
MAQARAVRSGRVTPALGLAIVLVLLVPARAHSKAESECSQFAGAAHGLCTAYCRHCPAAKGGVSCARLRQLFASRTGQSVFPCEVQQCGEFPVGCEGQTCPVNQLCAYGPFGGGDPACECRDDLGTGSTPCRDGRCAPGQICQRFDFDAQFLWENCIPAVNPPCSGADSPQCDGVCPDGYFCTPDYPGGENPPATPCFCLQGPSANVFRCGDFGGAPACLGGCPPEEPLCIDRDGTCTCVAP